MGHPHSLDLRRRIVSAVESGSSCRAAAERFEVSASSAIKLLQRWRRTGDYAPGRRGGGRKRKLTGHEDWLHGAMAAEPDITLVELQRRLAAEKAMEVSLQAINTTLRALGYSYKKNRAGSRTGPARHRPQAPKLAQLAELAETGAPDLHRRDRGQDQHDPPARPLRQRRAPGCRRAVGALEDHHLRRRP